MVKNARQAGDGSEEICAKITPEMMDAGRKAFFERMLAFDYLSQAPTAQGLDEVVSSVFRAMSLAKPSDWSHIT